MDDSDSDMLLRKIAELSPQLDLKNQTKILAQIILLIEAQRQGVTLDV